jgi:hypothetical protein
MAASVGAHGANAVLGKILGIRLMVRTPAGNLLDEFDIDGVRHVLINLSTTSPYYGYVVPKG